MPARRAASGLPPTARVRRPKVVRLSRSQPTTADEREDDDEHGHPDDAAVEEVDEVAVADDLGASLGDHLGEAAGRRQHRQRDDERSDPAVGDEHPVDEAARGADEDRGEHHDDPVEVLGHGLGGDRRRPDRREARRSAPTDRSMPPPQMTKVMPMLMTPITEASRRIVMALSNEPNRSPAVAMPTTQSRTRAITQTQVAAERSWRAGRRARALLRGLRRHRLLAVRVGRGRSAASGGTVGGSRVDAHAASPLMMMSSTPCSSISVLGPSCSTLPSAMTRTRSERPRTSSISLDTTTTATPLSASRRTRA